MVLLFSILFCNDLMQNKSLSYFKNSICILYMLLQVVFPSIWINWAGVNTVIQELVPLNWLLYQVTISHTQ